MDKAAEQLLQDLQNPDGQIRELAVRELWQRWFGQKGMVGLQRIQEAQVSMQKHDMLQAEALLTQLVEDMPDFAEAWNRRAVLYFIQHRYSLAIADCLEVLKLNPHHFGALHGLGLCYFAINDYPAAIQAFRDALVIVPYSLDNQRLILECTMRLG